MWAAWQGDKRASLHNVASCFENREFVDVDPAAGPAFEVEECADYIWRGQGFYD